MYLFVVSLFAASALLAGPAAADPPINPWTRVLTTSTHDVIAAGPTPTDPILTGWTSAPTAPRPLVLPSSRAADEPAFRARPTEHRLTDADCTCLYDAPIPSVGEPSAWALRAPNGCARPCKELPGYDQLMSYLATLPVDSATATDPRHHTMNPLVTGLPPWRCSDKTGDYSSGNFWVTCQDALRFERYVYCHADCGCQVSLENAVSSGGCDSYHTNCGTTCTCLDGNNWNPFSQGCDCDGLADPACRSIYDQMHKCIEESHNGQLGPGCPYSYLTYYQDQMNAKGCVAHDGAGVNPGHYNFPPALCDYDPGCDVANLNTAGNSGSPLCPPPPPPVPSGTSSNGDHPTPPPPVITPGPGFGSGRNNPPVHR